MRLKRLDLPDGQWADLAVRPSHSDYIAIIEAAEDAANGTGSIAGWYETMGKRYCKAWSIRNDEGQPVDIKDWSGVDDPDLTDAIITEARNRWDEWQEQRVPLVARRERQSRREAPETPSEPGSEASPSPSQTTG